MSRSPPQRAYELGLISRLVEPGEATNEARRLATQITASAPLAVWESRKVVLASAYDDEASLKKLTDVEFMKVMQSEDTKEGLKPSSRSAPRRGRVADGHSSRYVVISRATIPARS